MFPGNYFDAVVGYSEERPSKPDPYGVQLICQECECTSMEAIYIGDGKSDVITAANAGIPCVYVSWGQGKISDWNSEYTAKIANNVDELRTILLGGS